MDPNQRGAKGLEFFALGGEVGRRLGEVDWSATAAGPVESWPRSLLVVLRIMLGSRYPMWLGWGPELTFFCNDAYRPTLGVKYPWALGKSAREVWAEIWQDIGPRAEAVLEDGVATWDEGLLLFLNRSGYLEETHHTFSYSPAPNDDGGVGGLLCVVTEETERVISERRVVLLRELAQAFAETQTEVETFGAFEATLSTPVRDLPFALVYTFEPGGRQARLRAASGVEKGSELAPAVLDLEVEKTQWPVGPCYAGEGSIVVEELDGRFQSIPLGPWDKPAQKAVVVPIARQGQHRPGGFLVAGVNPYRPLDRAYHGFLDLLSGQIASALGNARAYEDEKRKAESLAELDRAKTAFFSNVSHEFRTPLTLILGPIEDILRKPDVQVFPRNREVLEIVHRNGLRLLKLVNTLLDFSRIEAGRVQANYEPTDLSSFTLELAGVFRSAIERAGMILSLDCPPLPRPIYVDRDMWEKIVLNLISNAFKYTLEGSIHVSLAMVDDFAELAIRDTGIGIAPGEIPNLFNRFHRVESARGRTQEGTGIGLALVQELVKLHGGSVALESELGEGSVFFVRIPAGSGHLPADRIRNPRTLVSTALGADPYVEEALRWLPEETARQNGSDPTPRESGALERIGSEDVEGRSRIVIVDDNADMRSYVSRLLGETFDVSIYSDGMEALEEIRKSKPDLVLSDVMMPRLDGFGLLKAIREDERISGVPVILLSAPPARMLASRVSRPVRTITW